jgi:hypothetical protein
MYYSFATRQTTTPENAVAYNDNNQPEKNAVIPKVVVAAVDVDVVIDRSMATPITTVNDNNRNRLE